MLQSHKMFWSKLPAAQLRTNTYKLTHTQDLPMAVSDLHIFIVSESPHFSWPVFFTSSVKYHGG